MTFAACYRCGVEFDPTDYILGSPCPDCQPDVGGEWRKLFVVEVAERARRDNLIKEFHARNFSDRQIAEAIGISSRRMVSRYRTELGIPAHEGLGGATLWTEEDIERMTGASRAYWADPDRKPRRPSRGSPVQGNLGLDRAGRNKEDVDERYNTVG